MESINGFTEETEIMTTEGFKKYYELTETDNIYIWEDGAANTKRVTGLVVDKYDGDTHIYRGRDMYQQFTPNHNILHQKNNSKEIKITNSSELISRKSPLTMPVSFKEVTGEDYPISDDLLELLTIIICDGSIKSNTSVRIFKSHRRYGTERIIELLDKLHFNYSIKEKISTFETALTKEEQEKYENNKYPVNVFTIIGCRELVDLLNGTKKVLPKFMEQLSQRQSELVINTWSKFDGNVDKTCYGKTKLQVDNYVIAEQLSHICIRACKRPLITERVIGDNKKPTIYVLLHQRNAKSAKIKEIVNYKGLIWNVCMEGKIGLFRARNYVFFSVI